MRRRLFGVLGAESGQQRVKGRDVACGADGSDARVERAGKRSDGSSARATESADAMRINLRERCEEIHSTHCVPNLVAGKSVADQHGILQPLALANGIVGEHDEAIAGKDHGDRRIARFSARRMARTHEDRRTPAVCGRAVGNIEQSGNEEVGLALEDYFANAESVCLSVADEFCIERRAQRKSAGERENLRAHPGLASQSLSARVNGGYRGCTVGLILGRNAVEILIELETALIGRVCIRSVRRRCDILRRRRWLRGGLSKGKSCPRKRDRGEKSCKRRSSHDYALILQLVRPVNYVEWGIGAAHIFFIDERCPAGILFERWV